MKSIVSGRVDADVKSIADAYIRREGLTPADVIVAVWDRIASTGEVPGKRVDDTARRKAEAWHRLQDLRAETPTGTPLASMTDADIREALASRD